jgi:hypothetical protein
VDVYTEEDPMDLTALPDIGFAEFTTQLINDVFDGLVSQNIRQVQSYLELVEGLAATDKSYVESAYSDISDDQADVLLYKALPDTSESSTEGHLVIAGGTLTEAQADLLNAALQLPEADGGLTTNMAGDATADNKVAVATATDQVLDSTPDPGPQPHHLRFTIHNTLPTTHIYQGAKRPRTGDQARWTSTPFSTVFSPSATFPSSAA